MRRSSRNRVNTAQRFNMQSIALATFLPPDSFLHSLTYPRGQIGNQRRAEFLGNRATLLSTASVEVTLDVEQPVDALNCFQAERR